ncbi:hypothetical protein RJ640_015576 [Escallonia rubra]|uniref:Uncharacterized protein n=1 Tax=Escallonia rubra TaxID=112253 RepID=A0AA88UAE8_9ASTE|nr:hypothetical protein RJ640_015576 [Escallonia rubra]
MISFKHREIEGGKEKRGTSDEQLGAKVARYEPSSPWACRPETSAAPSLHLPRRAHPLPAIYDSGSDRSCSFTASLPPEASSAYVTENLSDFVVDIRLDKLASKTSKSAKSSSTEADFLDLSQAFSDFSAYSFDISGELQRLASVSNVLENVNDPNPSSSPRPEPEPCSGFLQRDNFSTEIIESISPEDLLPTVKICIDGLQSPSVAIKRSAAVKLRLLAKNRSDNRALIGESGAIPALTPLLRCSDSLTQEHAVTALLNLSLHEVNKPLIANAGAIKSLIYVLKTGTETLNKTLLVHC